MTTPTTTIRISREAHAQLVELSEASGSSLVSTVEDAIEALLARRFGEQVAAEMEALHADPEAWKEYLADVDYPASLDLPE